MESHTRRTKEILQEDSFEVYTNYVRLHELPCEEAFRPLPPSPSPSPSHSYSFVLANNRTFLLAERVQQRVARILLVAHRELLERERLLAAHQRPKSYTGRNVKL